MRSLRSHIQRIVLLLLFCTIVLPGAVGPIMAEPLLTGWELCIPENGPDDCGPLETSIESRWRPVPPGPLFFRIQTPTERWLRVTVPDDPQCRDPAVYFGVINLSFVAYFNGDEVYRFGDPDAGPAGFAGRPYHIIPIPATPEAVAPGATARPDRLTLRIWSDFRNIGIDGGPPQAGCYSDLQRRIVREDMFRFGIGVLAVLIGLAGCLMYLRQRASETVYLAFALFCCNVGISMISNRTLRLQHLLLPEPLFWLYCEHFALYSLPAAFGFYFQQIAVNSRSARALALVQAAMAAIFVTMSLFGVPVVHSFGSFLYLSLIPAAGYLYVIPITWRRGPPEVRIVVAGLAASFAPGLADALWAVGLIPWWPGPLAPYGFFLMLALMGVGVWRRYKRIQVDLTTAHARLREYALNLEQQVEARTIELSRSLQQVSALKEQQDGDYLLIARVLGPMTRAVLRSELIHVDSLVRQYKRFEYRKLTGELGGDLCMAGQVFLGGETYLAWLNADAMGKSVQGASGAIVLAVAFRAFLNWSADGRSSDVTPTPAEWVLRFIEELRRIFRPFEGRMLASLAVGLLHETSGNMHCVNAGHPRPVLLRAGRAEYVLPPGIDPIGAQEIPPDQKPESVSVATLTGPVVNEFTLRPGDIFIAGSDGRDDLRREHATGPPTTIDHDESRFLNIVEETHGNLEAIARKLMTTGQFTDDLSLLRLAYRGNVFDTP